jgi:hypothetical protein
MSFFMINNVLHNLSTPMTKKTLFTALALPFLLWRCDNPSQTGTAEETAAVDNPSEPVAEEWVALAQDDSKEDFIQLNGQATYEIKDGVITGTTKLGEPNSFLAPDKTYSDFVLEYEVMVDPELNSGVQIRSQSFDHDTTYVIINEKGEQEEKKVEKDRVHGYQVEIDPSERGYSGGIYDEARRGWLADLSDNEEARNAFKNGEWNKFRIEAIGDTIRTWVNDVPAATLIDSMNAEGIIAFQVHSTDIEKPMQVQWRNIRIKEL